MQWQFCSVLYCCLAVLDPRVGHTMDILSPLNEVVDALAPNSFPFLITVAVHCAFWCNSSAAYYRSVTLLGHVGGKTLHLQTHTHSHPFNGPLSGTTWVSRYEKGKTNLDFTEARDSEWQWHQLGHVELSGDAWLVIFRHTLNARHAKNSASTHDFWASGWMFTDGRNPVGSRVDVHM